MLEEFQDENIKKTGNTENPGNNSALTNSEDNSNTKLILVGVGVFFVIVVISVASILSLKSNEPPTEIVAKPSSEVSTSTDREVATTSTPIISTLPRDENDENEIATTSEEELLKSEILAFGNFYTEYSEEIESEITELNLPISIKVDVTNYHDVSRKINLDPYINDLNVNGFSIIDNPFGNAGDNFFSAFSTLSAKEIPILISTDFISYFYQNTIKAVFKGVEKEIFYDDLWEISKSLFLQADRRYKNRLSEVGYINDPLLEGARREAAYFATVLEILRPKEEQITSSIKNVKMFRVAEMSKYAFVLPDYLKNDVLPEIQLILNSTSVAKSPVLLYSRDYGSFVAPMDYKNDAKLNNFYLATNWLSSPFPTYYQGALCPDCLLDKEDWIINFLTAHYISEDFTNNQEITNKWANIYKILSYFVGLKKGINYTQVASNFEELFPEKSIDEIFSLDNANRNQNITSLQKKLLASEFRDIEGGLDVKIKENYSKIGLRVLQDQYWPNDFIFNKLTNTVGGYRDKLTSGSERPVTYCSTRDSTFRCRGIGLDVISLVSEIKGDEYYEANTNYSEYNQAIKEIRAELNDFNDFDWHNNNYWNTLDIIGKYLDDAYRFKTPSYFNNDEWRARKVDLALALWTNIHTPLEGWQVKQQERTDSFDIDNVIDIYIEPDMELIKNLSANSVMLRDMLLALEIIDENKSSYLALNSLVKRLDDFSNIVSNELINIGPDYYDLKNLDNLIQKYSVIPGGETRVSLEFDNGKNIFESIKGIRYLAVIHEINGEKKISIGPIFNYTEYLK